MFRLADISPSPETLAKLAEYQAEVDEGASYADRVALAKKKFPARNRAGNRCFDEVKSVLERMCCGAKRCAYCEDSAADEVEHIRPKDWFPQDVFRWPNYLYACGPCNGPKNSKYAVFLPGASVPFPLVREADDVAGPPPDGDDVLINPRREDPFDLLILDLGTFHFEPKPGIGAREEARARYTRDLLRLNTRDVLRRARKDAFVGYRSMLQSYVDEKAAGGSQARRDELRDTISTSHHRTVWLEMKRQHASYPELDALFAAAPEALDW